MPQPTSDGSRSADVVLLARRPGVQLVAPTSRTRSIADVAFDEVVFESDALDVRGTLLERGRSPDGDVLAAASVEWPEMPVGWVALQSRRGPDHLGLDDEHVVVGHARFDASYAVDTDLDPDDPPFTRLFNATVLDWLADLDDEHGPLTIILDSTIGADRRDRPAESAIYVVRVVDDADDLVATARLVAQVADHLAAATRN